MHFLERFSGLVSKCFGFIAARGSVKELLMELFEPTNLGRGEFDLRLKQYVGVLLGVFDRRKQLFFFEDFAVTASFDLSSSDQFCECALNCCQRPTEGILFELFN